MQQASIKLTRFDLELLAGMTVDDPDFDAALADPLAQLRGEIPLDLFAVQLPDTGQERGDASQA